MPAQSRITVFAATARTAGSLAFYRDTCEPELQADNPFPILFEANGTDLRVRKVEVVACPPHAVIGWEAADIEAAVDARGARSLPFCRFGSLPTDELGIWSRPDGVIVAWFADPDDHTLSPSQATRV